MSHLLSSDNEFGGYIYSCGTASLNSSGYFTATCQNTRGDSKNTGIQLCEWLNDWNIIFPDQAFISFPNSTYIYIRFRADYLVWLAEHFVTVNGNVVSNLNGPRAPAPPTPIDPPAGSLLYISEFFFGNSQDSATCNYASGGENYFTLYSTAPISCYRLDFDQLGGVTHAKFKVNPGYEYVLYNGTECAGEPVKRSGPAISLNTCDVVSASPLSVILKPVWITNWVCLKDGLWNSTAARGFESPWREINHEGDVKGISSVT